MRRALVLALALGAAGLVCAQVPQPDNLLRAMHDEIARAAKLRVADLEAPYFVEYTVADQADFAVSASLGGLLSRREDHFRLPDVSVRVGDYHFDNTNYAGSGFNFGTRYDLERFPLADDYPLLRRYLWLLTDSAYKSAVEAISRKRAALRDMQQTDRLDDFAHAQPVTSIRDLRRLSLDEDQWAARVRTLSAVFDSYPAVKTSGVQLEASAGGFTLVNTEGTQVREPESAAVLRIRATAQAADGMTVRDATAYHAPDVAELPSEAAMQQGAADVAANVTALARAPMGEDYNGPVLFEGMAGAQVFAEVLGRNLTISRTPVGARGGVATSDLDGRLGARVLPDTFDVVDDPTQTEWRGHPLFGSYQVDQEGVPARPLRVVEKGVLKAYLLTRQPVRGFEGSNGHGRLPGRFGAGAAAVSNLFVRASDAVTPGELKKKLIELVGARNKPYGILVRKMDFPSTGTIAELRALVSSQQDGRPVSLPLLVYKVYPDGREELVRGLRFRGFNVRSLKDILAAGNDANVFEWMESTAPFAVVGGAMSTTESCVVGPSILVDDLELHPLEGEQPKLPIVPPPGMTP